MSGLDKIDNFLELSKEYYNSNIKSIVESNSKGKYIAISYEVKKYWIGESMTEALKSAKHECPDKLFYVVQIGSDSVFTIQSISKKNF
ncbi:MAG TPA: hypothetical protein VIK14_04815 [Ignavibacteria bacterium]